MVEGAPADPGVYALWEAGGAHLTTAALPATPVSIQFALLEHLNGRAGACTQRATHYGWEISLDPAAREAGAAGRIQGGVQAPAPLQPGARAKQKTHQRK